MVKHIVKGTLITVSSLVFLSGCGASENIRKEAPYSEAASEISEVSSEVTSEETSEETEDFIEFSEAYLDDMYEKKKAVSNHKDFGGHWARTQVHSSSSGDIEIENVNDEGFHFSGEFYYYSHSGEVEGDAFFISEDTAICRQFDEEDIDGEPAYIGLRITDGFLSVIESGFVEGLGMNVYISGTYVQGEPDYTNANIVESTFSDSELDEMKVLLGEDSYKELFIDDTELGVVTCSDITISDGRAARLITCTVPTMGGSMGYEMIITDEGKIYFKHEKGIFVTNDDKYEDLILPDHNLAVSEKSPSYLWEYNGYLDECDGYYWQDEFINCDYDGDGKTDRLKRKWISTEQIARYTVEFGNGNILNVPDCWETGFPHVQGGDLDKDGEKEILVSLSYDTGTDPLSVGEFWLFDKTTESGYKEVFLPLADGESGAKGFNIDYKKPVENTVSFSFKEADFSMDSSFDDFYMDNWWTQEATTGFRPVYWVDIFEEDNPRIRCYVEPFLKSGVSIGFDLVYENGEYEAKNFSEDSHEF